MVTVPNCNSNIPKGFHCFAVTLDQVLDLLIVALMILLMISIISCRFLSYRNISQSTSDGAADIRQRAVVLEEVGVHRSTE